jgi:phytoene dehydrogenase-like protein
MKQPLSFPGGSNLDFWFKDGDFIKLYQNIGQLKTDNKPNHLIFLHTPQDIEAQTMLILYFCRENQSTDWHEEKHQFADKIVAATQRLIPGFHDAVEVLDIGSPTTFKRFTSNTEGALYGFENTKDIYGEAKMPNTTYLSNLFQTGHWCKPGGGIWNVIECGYTTACIILHR